MNYFTLQELTRSQTARQRGLDNTPDAAAVENLQSLVTHILDPLRQLWGSPLYVNSGYRSPAVNAAVGGARNRQQLTGCAADIIAGSSCGHKETAFSPFHRRIYSKNLSKKTFN